MCTEFCRPVYGVAGAGAGEADGSVHDRESFGLQIQSRLTASTPAARILLGNTQISTIVMSAIPMTGMKSGIRLIGWTL